MDESSKGLTLGAFLEPEGRDAPLMCVRVPARAELVSAARAIAGLTLKAHGVAPAVVVAAELIVSEVATNVVFHNKWDLDPVIVLIMSKAGSVLRIEAVDSEPAIPKIRELTADSESGRGLQIVQAVSDRWGVDLIPPDGKVVWCELVAWPDETDQR
ncbi:MAG TPA: ATP-binding protein [Actinocrinis sp.]|nr:ATP-binding protein [Actinocrinis sp.]